MKWNEEFKNWFVGFSEGDGSLFNTNKGNDIRFEIWQSRYDTKVLEYIQSQLGFGKITFPKHRPDMAIFVVTRDEDIKVLETIFITRMCVSSVNSRLNHILKINNQLSLPTLGNAWLSGLIDAEGCFWIKQEAKTNTFKFIFEISQKDKNLLLSIRALFSFNPEVSNIYWDGSCWKLCFYSSKVRNELIAYITKYNLQSHKKQVYDKWIEGLRIKATKDPEKTRKLIEIKQNLNTWRKDQ